jgi:hypothetical protein
MSVKTQKVRNAAPKKYKARMIAPGLVNYDDLGIGNVLVRKPALDKINPGWTGKPVFNMTHRDVSEIEAFDFRNEDPENFADGIITESVYDDASGFYVAEFLVWDAETQDTLDLKDRTGKPLYSVSCAYTVTEEDETGGEYNGIPFTSEVLNGRADHLAIVNNPRYPDAVLLENAKPDKEKSMGFKLFLNKGKEEADAKKRKNELPPPEPEENDEDVEVDGYVEMENGEKVPMNELVAAYNEKMKNAEEEDKKYDMEDEVVVNGETMKVKDLVAACGYGTQQENAEAPTDEKAEDVVDEKKQISNSKKEKNENFRKVANAAKGDDGPVERNVNTATKRLERGKQRYTIPKKGVK